MTSNSFRGRRSTRRCDLARDDDNDSYAEGEERVGVIDIENFN